MLHFCWSTGNIQTKIHVFTKPTHHNKWLAMEYQMHYVMVLQKNRAIYDTFNLSWFACPCIYLSSTINLYSPHTQNQHIIHTMLIRPHLRPLLHRTQINASAKFQRNIRSSARERSQKQTMKLI